MFFWIYDIPTASLVILLAILFIGVTWAGILFIRPFLRLFIGSRPGVNELVGYILGSHGVFYGILLGLLSVAAYDRYNKVEVNVEEESAVLGGMYRLVSAYPEPLRTQMRKSLRDYTRYLIDDAWPEQRKGIVPTGGVKRTNEFQDLLYSFNPGDLREEILHSQAMPQFLRLVELRRLRLLNLNKGIPAILWYVVGLGAAINIVLVWAFDMRLSGQIILGGILSFFVAAVIAMIASMDYPFRGQVSVTAEGFELVYSSLMQPTQDELDGIITLKPKPEPKTEAENTPETKPVPEPKIENLIIPYPKPEAEAEAEPKPEPDPKPVAKLKPEPESEPEAETKPEPTRPTRGTPSIPAFPPDA